MASLVYTARCRKCEDPACGVLSGMFLCEKHLAEVGFGTITIKPYAETIGFTADDVTTAAELGILVDADAGIGGHRG